MMKRARAGSFSSSSGARFRIFSRSKNGMKQSGLSDTALLVVFVFFIILAVIALPKYLEMRETGVNALTVELHRIHKAQMTYRDAISVKRNFGSFRDLISVRRLSDNCPNCDANVWTTRGYRFEMNRNYEETRYCVRATGENKILAMDSSGKIYESSSNNLSCSIGEVTGDALREVK
jgi:hypothetical protein